MTKYNYYKSLLTDEEFKIAKELADLYNLMDTEPRGLNNEDISRFYAAKDKNLHIHYMALEINKRRWKKGR